LNRKVPGPTLMRLATYLTYLAELDAKGVDTISSAQMEDRTGINAAIFRKDLSYFGEFGKPGIGYGVHELSAKIAAILKVDREQGVLLVGAGNLGSAIVAYPGLRSRNFHIAAVFDNNYNKIGRKLWDLEILDIANVKEVNKQLGARIAILAIPASAAQEVAEMLVEADVRAILNFAPVTLRLSKHIAVRNADSVQELAVLSYHLSDQDA
jgi:redox-sensing transcriptional repressor